LVISLRYIGDPEHAAMDRETNPFLMMLAAIEDEEQQQPVDQHQHQHHHSAGNVKLPEYWACSPGIWFARVELRYEVCGIVSEREKFAHAVNALTQDATRLVTDLILTPPADRPYTILKERLLLAHQLTPVQKAIRVMAMPTLGDRRPSQLLADMLEFCPAGQEDSPFFRGAYIQRLPAELQVLLDGAEDGDLKQLAAKADKIWVTRRPANYHVAAVAATAVDSNPFEEDGNVLAAVKTNYKGRTNNNKQQGQGQGQRKPPKLYQLCYRHMRYGADAFKCEDPENCRWKGNQ